MWVMDKDKTPSQIYLGHKPPGCKTKKKKKKQILFYSKTISVYNCLDRGQYGENF
jgi:hypothetical protein